MRTFSAAVQTMLNERPHDATELLELIDVAGNAVRMSRFGEDVYVPSTGHTFLAFPGFNRNDMVYSNNGRAAQLDIQVPISPDCPVTPLQIRRGVWRQSQVRLWLADRTAPTQDSKDLLIKGFVGRTTTSDGVIGQLEVSTLAERNVDIILPKVAPSCSYVFGAGFGKATGCKVDVGAITSTGCVVTAVLVPRLSFTATISNPSSFDFSNGALKFTSGENDGIAGQVRLWTSGTHRVDLLRPIPYDIAPGDIFSIHPGCKRTLPDCVTFGGLGYFEGYAWAPGESQGN